MNAKNNYAGIDLFRLPAALLVVAIHTSPLASLSAEGDFFLTRVFARLAVPFFFMVTGQFILRDYIQSKNTSEKRKSFVKIRRYIRKILLLYGISILIYLPLGIYAGHYKDLTVRRILQMLLFDGTFYHLWYFPACITGIGMVCFLNRVMGKKAAFFITTLLYLAGLLGDSYFGIVLKVPKIAAFYEAGFQIWSYTRNGLFLAPVFLMLGVMASDSILTKKTKKAQKYLYASGFLCAFFLMTLEAFTLRHLKFQRHDSMYLMLIPASLFFYQILLSLPGFSAAGQEKKYAPIRNITLWIYILHPAMIIVVRVIAKISSFQILVKDSLMHFLCVAALSVVASLLPVFSGKCKKKRSFQRAERG